MFGQECVSLSGLTSLNLAKETSVCSADDSTTHAFTLTFCGAQGDLLELYDEDRYGGWDRDLDALDGDVRDTAVRLASHLGVQLFVKNSVHEPVRVFQPATPDMEQVHFEAGRFPQALDLCEQALLRQPGSATVLGRKGRILRRLGRHEEALVLYRQILQRDPDETGAVLGLADSLVVLKQRDEAIQLLQEAVSKRPCLHFRSALADLLGMNCLDESFEKLVAALTSKPCL
jgi:tetratricopeptide (TPR) repeat protein